MAHQCERTHTHTPSPTPLTASLAAFSVHLACLATRLGQSLQELGGDPPARAAAALDGVCVCKALKGGAASQPGPGQAARPSAQAPTQKAHLRPQAAAVLQRSGAPPWAVQGAPSSVLARHHGRCKL
eukprot:scaffold269956_cov17-Tisochrysis_lutea.AAC.1